MTDFLDVTRDGAVAVLTIDRPTSGELAEGVTAFTERRPPRIPWSG